MFGNHLTDLRDQIGSGARQHRIAASRHPARAQHRRFHFVRRQHQRRHVETAIQHITDAGLAADRHAIGHQLRDIAVDGAHRGFQFLGDVDGGHRPLLAPEHLDNAEQPVSASHDGTVANHS